MLGTDAQDHLFGRRIEATERQAEAAVTAAFQEMKRYEIAEENHRRRAQDKQRRREQAQLDETGLSRFQRTRQTG